MKSILLATAALLALSGGAFAADAVNVEPLPVASTYNWSGAYVGATAGGYWVRDSISTSTTNAGAFSVDPSTRSAGKLSPSGFIGGIQAGYNWQVNNLVIGLEADISATTGDASRTVLLQPPGFLTGDFVADQIKPRFVATVRPRLGYAFDRLLVFGTGGLAIGGFDIADSNGFFNGAQVRSGSLSETKAGWVVGLGAEYAFADHWTAKAEYLHADFGNVEQTVATSVGAAALQYKHDIVSDIVRVGLNYKF